jgi:hypothetical protein
MVQIATGCVGINLLDQFADAAERPAPYCLLGDETKPALDLIEPTGIDPSVVDVVARPARETKTIGLFHDIDRGLGHRVHSQIGREADREAPTALRRMLNVEAQAGVHATYHVIRSILTEVRDQIAWRGHSVAFHSYNHARWRQLAACRLVADRCNQRSDLTSEGGSLSSDSQSLGQ